jgi:hypothetical protein
MQPTSLNTCRDCGAPVLWLKHVTSGNKAPIHPQPADNGNITINLELGTYAVHSRPGGLFHPRYTSHMQTCPYAGRYAKK